MLRTRSTSAGAVMLVAVRFEGPNAFDAIDVVEAVPGVESVEPPSEDCVDVFTLLTKGLTELQVARTLIKRQWGSAT